MKVFIENLMLFFQKFAAPREGAISKKGTHIWTGLGRKCQLRQKPKGI